MKLVHAGSSRHQDMKEKIQSKLEPLAHPDDLVWQRLAWVTVESKMTARLLHSTNNKKKNIKVGVSTTHGYWVDIIGQLKLENSIYQYYRKSTIKLNM